MAYNKIPKTTVTRVIKIYGAHSKEAENIQMMADARMPYECVADTLMLDADGVMKDMTAEDELDGPVHHLLHNFVEAVLPLGIERGLFPSKDNAITTEILRVLVELLHLRNEVSSLQQGKANA